MYSVALVLAFLSAENENGQLEDLPLADFFFFFLNIFLNFHLKHKY